MIHDSDLHPPEEARDQFRTGIDDAIILPLVLIALFARTLYQAALFIVLLASNLVFALFLRVIVSLLLVAVVTGEGMAWLVKGLAGLPLLPGAKREALRDFAERRWSALRQRVSHKAVATTTQRVLQRAIAWCFQKCGALSPRAALLVVAGVMLWLPASAAISIAMHAVLLAKAASLPKWMQLLHPVATFIAKSKLLVLPAYPAAWPQAKKHAWVQAAFRYMHRITALDRIRKTAHRYRQTRQAFAQAADLGAGAGIKYFKCCRRSAVRIKAKLDTLHPRFAEPTQLSFEYGDGDDGRRDARQSDTPDMNSRNARI